MIYIYIIIIHILNKPGNFDSTLIHFIKSTAVISIRVNLFILLPVSKIILVISTLVYITVRL